MKLRGVSPVWYHGRPLRGDSESISALFEHLVADGNHEFRLGHDASPCPFVECRCPPRVGPDNAVDQRTPSTDYRRERILHRVATVGHDRFGVEACKDPAQPESQAGVESLGGAATSGMFHGQVDLHLGRAVEEPEQTVADGVVLIESVDQNPRCALRTSAPR